MAREDDIETIVPAASSDTHRTLPSLRASVSGFDATVPGNVEFTRPGEDDPWGPQRPAPEAGDRIGTFVVEKLLGRGAMGVVMLAYDPELDRRVAIKLLATDDTDPTASARLLREAQSAAGIAHPNVVAVYQVGTHDEQVYVVMEFVDGGTLHEWVNEEPRSWQAIVDAYLQAGEGLAAAHHLGLVHRDFKPDNVLIGTDGRVRVSDFGLVGRSGDTQDVVSTLRSFDGASGRLTQTGAIMGTPAYMPPEQLAGDRVDARSDQFSFAVSLYEALWGKRPYSGDTLGTIFAAIEAGTIDETPADDVPTSVREAVFKGLACMPRDRHEDVDAMLHALRAHRVPTRRRGPAIAAGVALLGLGAAASYFVGPPRATSAAFVCPEPDYGKAWDTERQSAVEKIFAAKPTGADMFAVLDAELQARQSEWTAGYQAACAARQSDEQSEAIYALRMECLEARRAEAELFSELLVGDDDRLIDGALSSATTFLPVAACEDVEALQAAPRPTREQADGLAPVRRELARARILLLAGRHAEVIELMTAQLETLREVAFGSDLAKGLEIMARAQMQLADYEKAEANLREALTLAAESRDHGTEARATGTLIFIVGQRQKRYDEAQGMLPGGRAAAARSPDPRALSYLEAAIATLYMAQERYDEALAAVDRAIETLEALERPPPDELANAYSGRAEAKTKLGDAEGAVADHERAVAIAKAGLGEKHPFYGAFAMRLGMSLNSEGKYEQAITVYREALSAWEATYGKDHSSCALAVLYIGMAQRQTGDLVGAVASFEDGIGRNERGPGEDARGLISLVDNLAYTRLHLGEWDAAFDAYVRARDLVVETGGKDDPRIAEYDRALASVLAPQERYADSLEHLERNRTRLVALHGPKHPEVAVASALIGDTYLLLDDCDAARKHYGNALKIRSDLQLAPDDALAQLLVGSGQCDLASGDVEAGRESIDHAVALAKDSEDAQFNARLEFARALLLWHDGAHDEARALATTAAKRLEDEGPAYRNRAARMRAWVSAHLEALR
ncbi:MAG: tetratricopeptide repeat protein [Myxococcota bacterium]